MAAGRKVGVRMRRMVLITAAVALFAPARAPGNPSDAIQPPNHQTAQSPDRAAAPIPFRGLEAAAEEAMEQQRVLAVYFTADWCGFCRRMEQVTFADPGVRALAGDFVWAQVDIDRDVEAAAMLGVRAVPQLILLNARGEELDRLAGYAPPEVVQKLLSDHQGAALAPGRARQEAAGLTNLEAALASADTDSAFAQALTDVLDHLVRPDTRPADRARLRAAVAAVADRARPLLVESLASDRLARRAVAHDLLRQLTPAPGSPAPESSPGSSHENPPEARADAPPFDPFADEATRAEQLKAWHAREE